MMIRLLWMANVDHTHSHIVQVACRLARQQHCQGTGKEGKAGDSSGGTNGGACTNYLVA
jgi:hypothetical protein